MELGATMEEISVTGIAMGGTGMQSDAIGIF